MSRSVGPDIAEPRVRRAAAATKRRAPDRAAVFLTAKGLARLESQREILTSRMRPELAERLRGAREFGSSAENGELVAAIEEREVLDGLIAHISDLIRHAVVITRAAHADGSVRMGTEVRLATASGVESFRILGRLESDPSAGRISNESPLGRALLGHSRQDRITWFAPSGVQRATVLAVGN